MRDDDRTAYEKFFEQFGRTLKFGIYQSYGMAKDTLGDLLLFYSAKEQKMITLDEYLAAAPPAPIPSSTPRAIRWSVWPPCRS